MDEMEENTVNDDLRACDLLGDDDVNMAAGYEALFGSSLAPINVKGGDGDDASAGGGDGTSMTPTPTSKPTPTSGDFIVLKRVRSNYWTDFEPIFETLPSGKKVRRATKCRHCKHVLSGHSSSGTGHLLRHQRQYLKKAKHATLVQSRLQFGGDGSISGWEYKPDVARRELCRLISRLDLSLGFGYEEAFEEYIQRAHNPCFSRVLTILVFEEYIQLLSKPLLEIWKKYFLECRTSLIESLRNVLSVCITSDIWSGNAKTILVLLLILFLLIGRWRRESLGLSSLIAHILVLTLLNALVA
ncbi:unnamed protein product [Urochloa humidicola]